MKFRTTINSDWLNIENQDDKQLKQIIRACLFAIVFLLCVIGCSVHVCINFNNIIEACEASTSRECNFVARAVL